MKVPFNNKVAFLSSLMTYFLIGLKFYFCNNYHGNNHGLHFAGEKSVMTTTLSTTDGD